MSNLIDHDYIHISVFFFFFCLMNPALCYFINSSVIGYGINLKWLEWCCYIIALIHLHILMTFVVWFDIFIYIFVRAEFQFCNGGEFCLQFFYLFEYEIIMIECVCMWCGVSICNCYTFRSCDSCTLSR